MIKTKSENSISKEWPEFEAHLRNKGISEKRQAKLLMCYKLVRQYLPKVPAAKLERKHIQPFIEGLNNNTIRQTKNGQMGKLYAGNTKADIKKFLKQWLKHVQGNDEVYPDCVRWISCRVPKQERKEAEQVLTEKEVNQLANAFHKIEHRMMTLLLYDSGFRIDEMLSVRKSGLTLEPYDKGQECYFLICTRSKTYTRKIPVPIYTNELDQFRETSYFRGLESNEPLFKSTYAAYLKALKGAAARSINKGRNEQIRMHPHLLRHSSATRYAKLLKGNIYAIANRYGWRPTSKELQEYVRTSGAYTIEAAEAHATGELHEVNKELKELKGKYQLMESTLIGLTQTLLKDPALAKAMLEKGIVSLDKTPP